MFQDYAILDESRPSSWIVWKTGSKPLIRKAKICHADMRYDDPGLDNLVTAVPKSDELSLEYLRMLIRGPFRSLSHLIRLDRLKNYYYLHCLSLDQWPANVLMNLCIASRLPIEFAYLLEPWAKRCEKGFDPTLAFLLTYSFGSKQDTSRTFSFTRPGHLWLDAGSSWTKILTGTMVNLSETYKVKPQASTPTNVIWGHSPDYQKIGSMSDEQIADFYKLPPVVEKPQPPPPKPLPKKKGLGYAQAILQQMQLDQEAQPAIDLGQILHGGGVMNQALDALAPHDGGGIEGMLGGPPQWQAVQWAQVPVPPMQNNPAPDIDLPVDDGDDFPELEPDDWPEEGEEFENDL